MSDRIYLSSNLGENILVRSGDTLKIAKRNKQTKRISSSGVTVIAGTTTVLTEDVDLTIKMRTGDVNPTYNIGIGSKFTLNGNQYVFTEFDGVSGQNTVNGLEVWAVAAGLKDSNDIVLPLPVEIDTFELYVETVTGVNAYDVDIKFAVEFDGTELCEVLVQADVYANTSPSNYTFDIKSLFFDNLPVLYAS